MARLVIKSVFGLVVLAFQRGTTVSARLVGGDGEGGESESKGEASDDKKGGQDDMGQQLQDGDSFAAGSDSDSDSGDDSADDSTESNDSTDDAEGEKGEPEQGTATVEPISPPEQEPQPKDEESIGSQPAGGQQSEQPAAAAGGKAGGKGKQVDVEVTVTTDHGSKGEGKGEGGNGNSEEEENKEEEENEEVQDDKIKAHISKVHETQMITMREEKEEMEVLKTTLEKHTETFDSLKLKENDIFKEIVTTTQFLKYELSEVALLRKWSKKQEEHIIHEWEDDQFLAQQDPLYRKNFEEIDHILLEWKQAATVTFEFPELKRLISHIVRNTGKLARGPPPLVGVNKGRDLSEEEDTGKLARGPPPLVGVNKGRDLSEEEELQPSPFLINGGGGQMMSPST